MPHTTIKLKMNIEAVREYISNEPENTRIYIGSDSSTTRKKTRWFADYVTVVVIHKGGKHGCKIFGEVVTEEDYTQDKSKPIMRLMNEAIKTAMIYEELKESIGKRYREIHLDINSGEEHNSHLALSQAVGYIKGVCGIDPKIKPDAFAASACADRFMRVQNYDIAKPNIDGFHKMYLHNLRRKLKAKKKKRA